MRLGAYPCALKPKTLSRKQYMKEVVFERHRHRYEFNNAFASLMEEKGLVIAGEYRKRGLAEIVEYRHHPWFIAVQFHPEFKSSPVMPHPLFAGFVKAACEYKKGRGKVKASGV